MQPVALSSIVFIHGLSGNRETTWTHKVSKICWPEHLLPESLPKARIMTFGYDADVSNLLGSVSQNRVGNHAGNLVSALANKRDMTETVRGIVALSQHLLVSWRELISSTIERSPHHLRRTQPRRDCLRGCRSPLCLPAELVLE